MNNFKFEKLIIWQKAKDFGDNIDILSDRFPDKRSSTSLRK